MPKFSISLTSKGNSFIVNKITVSLCMLQCIDPDASTDLYWAQQALPWQEQNQHKHDLTISKLRNRHLSDANNTYIVIYLQAFSTIWPYLHHISQEHTCLVSFAYYYGLTYHSFILNWRLRWPQDKLEIYQLNYPHFGGHTFIYRHSLYSAFSYLYIAYTRVSIISRVSHHGLSTYTFCFLSL